VNGYGQPKGESELQDRQGGYLTARKDLTSHNGQG
jgi:hypothetical protein